MSSDDSLLVTPTPRTLVQSIRTGNFGIVAPDQTNVPHGQVRVIWPSGSIFRIQWAKLRIPTAVDPATARGLFKVYSRHAAELLAAVKVAEEGDHAVGYSTKASGERVTHPSGMVRDNPDGKPRFDLITPLDLPYREQMLTRWAALMERGAKHYGDRNWERANGQSELDHAMASAWRHFVQWATGEDDEDHAAAVFFNIQEVEYVKAKMRGAANATEDDRREAGSEDHRAEAGSEDDRSEAGRQARLARSVQHIADVGERYPQG